MGFAARIIGTGSAFPDNRVTNKNLAEKLSTFGVKTNDEWIQKRTGIVERRISSTEKPSEHNSSLGAEASKNALKMANKTPADIDQIIYATCSPDTLIPSTACWLQHKIGAENAWAMDINAACSGFVYALSTADQFIKTGQAKTSLVVGADIFSSLLNWKDRNSCILFGDGAGAVVLEQADETADSRILSSHLLSNGSLWQLFYIPAGGSNLEVTPDRYQANLHKVKMNGKEVFKTAVKIMVDFALQALKKNRMTIDDLDWFVPHQANLRIIEAVSKRLNLPKNKVLMNVDRFGNTSAATVPTALDEAVRDDRIKKGDLILLDSVGAGLTYGSILFRW